MWDKLPVETPDLLLCAINVMLFYMIQTAFFIAVGSKTNLSIIYEVLNTVRDAVLKLTYNKIDINDYIGLTEEETANLEEKNKIRDEYNNGVLKAPYAAIFISILAVFTIFTFAPDTSRAKIYGAYPPLRNTFFNKTNTILVFFYCIFIIY